MEDLQKTNGEEVWGSHLQGTELFNFYLVKSWGLDPCLRLRTCPSALLDGSQCSAPYRAEPFAGTQVRNFEYWTNSLGGVKVIIIKKKKKRRQVS